MKIWQKYILAFSFIGILLVFLFSGYIIGYHEFLPYEFARKVEIKIFGHYLDRVENPPQAPPKYYDSIFLRLYSDQVDMRDRLSRAGRGGGMTSFGEAALLLTYDGQIFDVRGADDIRKTKIDVPNNGFSAYKEAAKLEEFKDLNHHFSLFRYNDIIFYDSKSHRGLAISYTEFDGKQNCYRNTIASLPLAREVQSIEQISAKPSDWDILYRTQPCLPLKEQASALDGARAGGRITFKPPASLFLSSGDYQWDNMNASKAIAQDPDYEYGKILKIDLDSNTGEIFATGVRNPQGIVFDKAWNLWTVEHAMRGGDELNLIEEGNNYGWPIETLGTQYSKLPPPLSTSETYGRHESDRFTEPVFAWLPSVAISNLTLVEEFHNSWDGDLLMGSLKSMSLFHIRIKDKRVMFSEQIEIGERIRYVHQHTDGRLIIWTDSKNLIFLTGQPYEDNFVEDYLAESIDNKELRNKVKTTIDACRKCHSIDPGDNELAPSLAMVFNTKIGSTDFKNYSSVLKNKEGVWTREKLRAFLTEPQNFAPGTTMPDPGINDAKVREEIINFLHEVRSTAAFD